MTMLLMKVNAGQLYPVPGGTQNRFVTPTRTGATVLYRSTIVHSTTTTTRRSVHLSVLLLLLRVAKAARKSPTARLLLVVVQRQLTVPRGQILHLLPQGVPLGQLLLLRLLLRLVLPVALVEQQLISPWIVLFQCDLLLLYRAGNMIGMITFEFSDISDMM
uniref:Uncharacterized protein n=1 Tax=Anopheles melas TaxID=34690 RepID=A0A182TM58_9DIPT